MDKDITSFLLNLLQTKGSDLQYGNENVTPTRARLAVCGINREK